MVNDFKKQLYDIGASTVSITPEPGVDIYTLEGVLRTSDVVHSKLKANAITIEFLKDVLIVVSLDLIWVDNVFTEKIRKWLRLEYKNQKTYLLLVATHSHSTPQISDKICNSARPDSPYLHFLYNQVCLVIKNAFHNKSQCYAELSITHPDLTVNRRKKIFSLEVLKSGIFKNITVNRPNYLGECDNSLHAIWFYDSQGKEKAVFLNYACHPTLFRENAVSADFPGIVSNHIKSQISKELVVCFLQGFSGNIKANLTKLSCSNYNGFFSYLYNCMFDRVQFNKNISRQGLNNFSVRLAQFALERNNPKSIKPELFFSSKMIKLPLQIGTLDQHPYLEVSYVSLGEKLKIIALSGEIFTEYSLWLRDFLLHKKFDLLTIGCCNDMVGYIPTNKAIRNGGYEVERTFFEFSNPSPFSDRIEDVLKKEIKELILQYED